MLKIFRVAQERFRLRKETYKGDRSTNGGREVLSVHSGLMTPSFDDTQRDRSPLLQETLQQKRVRRRKDSPGDTRGCLTILKHFSTLEDPRIDRTKQHLLGDIIAIAILAVLSGADSWVAIETRSIWIPGI